ncbi:MAG: imidazole glycerol phosphate synthase subunit HisH [Candidatus Limnocylindria bacterium]
MIGVVDFGAGNTRSVLRALAANGTDARLVRSPAGLAGAGRLILPGVGAAGSAMATLQAQEMVEPLRAWVAAGRPLLGICLGAQLMLDRSEEDRAEGLGLLPGACRRFPTPAAGGPRLNPHIGWNRVELPGGGFDAYFVHGYWLDPSDRDAVLGWTDVDGFRFPSVLRVGPLLGVQFHPEKSGPAGRALLAAWAAGLLDAAPARSEAGAWN